MLLRALEGLIDQATKSLVERREFLSDPKGSLVSVDDPSDPHPIDDLVFEFLNRRGGNAPWQDYSRSIASVTIGWRAMPPEEQVEAIWTHFDDRVDLASLFLFAHWPDRFTVLRDLGFYDEFFDGLDLLARDFPYLDIGLRRIGKNDREGYDKLNAALQRLADELWPAAQDKHARLLALVYRVLPDLVRPRHEGHQFWVGVTTAQHDIDQVLSPDDPDENWSSVRRAEPGDLYFMYCAAPEKALRAVYRITERPVCDPFGGWKGHWVDIHRLALFRLTFKQMRDDPILKDWTCIRRSFQGITLEQISPNVYHRIRELLLQDGVDAAILPPVDPAISAAAGEFESEQDFEIKRIQPLLKELGFAKSEYQADCSFHIGSGTSHCRIDFLVKDAKGNEISLFENKLTVSGPGRFQAAYQQAKSYALQLGLGSFVVGAPEGLSVFCRSGPARVHFSPHDRPDMALTWADLADDRGKSKLRDTLLDAARRLGTVR